MKYITGLLIIIMVSAVLIPAVSAAEFTLGTDIGNAYAPADSPLSDTSIFQTYINLKEDGISLEAWASYNTGDNPGDYQELRLEIAFVDESDFFVFRTGLVNYRFAEGNPSTSELFADLIAGPEEGLYGKFAFYFDIDEFFDYYASFGGGYYLAIRNLAGLRGELSAGLAGSSYSADGSGWYDLTVTASFEYYWKNDLTFTATLKHISTLDKDVYPVPDIDLYVLAGVSYRF